MALCNLVKGLQCFGGVLALSVGEPLHTECLCVVVNVSLNTSAVFYSKLFDGM
jgi:hypothetical protein